MTPRAVSPTSSTDPCARRLSGVRVLVLFGGAQMLGQERGNIEVFRALKEWGLEVRFITNSKWGSQEIEPALERFGFSWVTAPFGYQWGSFLLGRQFPYLFVNLYGVLATSWRVWREATRWQATHLYGMNLTFFSYALPAVFALPLPLIWRAGDAPTRHSFLHRWLVQMMAVRVAGMVCISRFIERCYTPLGVPPGRISIIYNYPPNRGGIDAPVQQLPVRQDDGGILVLYVGQIAKFKGVGLLVEAVASMVADGLNIHLWIAGGGHYDEEFSRELDTRIAQLGLESRVQRLGFVQDVASAFRAADVHVCPSMCNEALGNVVVEAKAEGVPSVVFPDGGLPELIEHGVDGYVCRACTVEALVEGLDYFIKDSGTRERCGAAARRSLEEKFGYEGFREQWAEVFLSTRLAPHCC